MSITIDPEKCTKDTLCSLACPAQIITMTGEDGRPAPADNFEDLCIACGHCLAVCPTGALTWKGMGPNQCPCLDDPLPSPGQLTRLLKGRRSIRRYKDQPLERSTIERLLELARYAPSGHNAQPVEWVIYSGREQVKRISDLVTDWMQWLCKHHPEIAGPLHMELVVAQYRAGHDRVFRGAPHLLLTHAHKDNGFAPFSAIIALTYLELAAYSLGLGACWAGYFYRAVQNYKPLQEFLALPPGHITLGGMMMGHAQHRYLRIPQRKPLQAIWR
jgi:nitroreductase/NAD-dependent dihydropyrimidine dehydrogenase PreA subunit